MLTIKNETGLVHDTKVLDQHGNDITGDLLPYAISIDIRTVGGEATAVMELPVKVDIVAMNPSAINREGDDRHAEIVSGGTTAPPPKVSGNVFVDLNKAPPDWVSIIEGGAIWNRSEPQPIADQLKLHDFSLGEGQALPEWIRWEDDEKPETHAPKMRVIVDGKVETREIWRMNVEHNGVFVDEPGLEDGEEFKHMADGTCHIVRVEE